MSKKIALVGNSAFSMYNFRVGLIKALLKKNYSITIIAPTDEYEPLISELDVKFIDLEMNRKGTNVLEEVRLYKELYRIYSNGDFDFIIHYTVKPNIYGSIAASRLKIPSLPITTGLGYAFSQESFSSRMVRFLYRYSLKKVSQVWFLNNEDRDTFLKFKIIGNDKAFVLKGEGVDLKQFVPVGKEPNSKIIFLMVCRILWDKGFKEYVEAAEQIKKKYTNIEFQLLGPIDQGNPMGVPENIVQEFHNKGVINYLGVTLDVVPFVAECDCMVLPSFYREGIPRSLMEASAMEKPIITTNNVGCKEVVDNNVTGFLCNKQDSLDLERKFEQFINLSFIEKQEMGKLGRQKMIKEFDENLVLEKYFNFIENTLNKIS